MVLAPCYAPHCGQPAGRQCPGFAGSCGRFYCPQHAEGTLCLLCAAQKAEYDARQTLLTEYFRVADTVPQHPSAVAALEATILWAGALAGWAALWPGGGGLGLVLVSGLAFVVWRIRTAQRAAAIATLVAELARTRPAFQQFYQAWLRRTEVESGDVLAGLLGASVGLAAVGLSVALAAQEAHQQHLE